MIRVVAFIGMAFGEVPPYFTCSGVIFSFNVHGPIRLQRCATRKHCKGNRETHRRVK